MARTLKCCLVCGLISIAVSAYNWNWRGSRSVSVAAKDSSRFHEKQTHEHEINNENNRRLPRVQDNTNQTSDTPVKTGNDDRLANNINTGVINTKGISQLLNVTDKKQQISFSHGTFYLATNIIKGVGLGNLIYMYASLVGLANSRNMTVALQANHPLRKMFHLKAMFFPKTIMFKTFKRVTSEKCCMYDETFLEMPRNRNYTIDSLLQSWKYFSHVESNIRHQLRFKDHIKSVAEKRIREIREKYQSKSPGEITLIGVHIRRGDKDSKIARKNGNYVAPPEYIKNAMAYYVSRFSNCVFVVCSDTMTWVGKHVKTNSGMELISETNSPQVDMAILSLCNHTIMTVGTFGWWGGYLAGGTVLYYKNPYDEKDQFWSKVFNMADYYPSHWIPMV
ncbi:galactoside alpha-(1,2)-fucosyltransferase 2-like [Gigantopelta aegis]|uniref:galactoside alpha-(1,2)-fucosyltransferase 2-like n=1 Tax=Gigantopelta aegis TaxID=1735272 RepID=UPI001B887D89|nr:galactoside alpha-(1,2)-fucosyltransferase 2-like [Gigantopelta aegis]